MTRKRRLFLRRCQLVCTTTSVASACSRRSSRSRIIFGSLITLAMSAIDGASATSASAASSKRRTRSRTSSWSRRAASRSRRSSGGCRPRACPPTPTSSPSCAGDAVGTYRYVSCAGDKVLSTNLNCPTHVDRLRHPDRPRTTERRRVQRVPVGLLVADSTSRTTARGRERDLYHGDAVSRSPSSSRGTTSMSAPRSRSGSSPRDCSTRLRDASARQTHPFAAPCQSFFYGQALAPEGQATVAGTVFGVDFTSGAITTTAAESTLQQEQVSQVQGSLDADRNPAHDQRRRSVRRRHQLEHRRRGRRPLGDGPRVCGHQLRHHRSGQQPRHGSWDEPDAVHERRGGHGPSDQRRVRGRSQRVSSHPTGATRRERSRAVRRRARPASGDLTSDRTLPRLHVRPRRRDPGFDREPRHGDHHVRQPDARERPERQPSEHGEPVHRHGEGGRTSRERLGSCELGRVLPAALVVSGHRGVDRRNERGGADRDRSMRGRSATGTARGTRASTSRRRPRTRFRASCWIARPPSGWTSSGCGSVRVGVVSMQMPRSRRRPPPRRELVAFRPAEHAQATVGSPVFGTFDYEVWVDGVQVVDLTINLSLGTATSKSIYQPAPSSAA